jgi:hypothetical protein
VAGIGERRQLVIECNHACGVRLDRQLLRDARTRIDELDLDRQPGIGSLVLLIADDRHDVRVVTRTIDAAIAEHRGAIRGRGEIRHTRRARLDDIGAQIPVADVRQIVAAARDQCERLRLIGIRVGVRLHRAARAARRAAARDRLAALADQGHLDIAEQRIRIHVQRPDLHALLPRLVGRRRLLRDE